MINGDYQCETSFKLWDMINAGRYPEFEALPYCSWEYPILMH